MLSLILSRLFKFAFIIFLIHAAGKLTSQLMRKPFTVPTGKGSYITLGEPGIQVPARISPHTEKKAPDTSVVTEIYSADGTKVGSGNMNINAHSYLDDSSSYRKRMREEYGIGMKMTRDTQITIIWHQSWEKITDQASAMAGFDSLPDGRVVVEKVITKTNGAEINSSDTLPDMRTAQIFNLTNQRLNKYNISEESGATHLLRVMPTNSVQLSWFVFYDVLRMGSFALLLLAISRLFKNFYKREYFTASNVRLLRLSGWYMLLPQALLTILYWGFLFHIHPIRIFTSTAGEFNFGPQYVICSGIEMPFIILGLALLILSYIFRDGMRLKEDQALTV
jgi:hypothetical protein